MRAIRATLLGLVFCFGAAGAAAEPVTLDVVVTSKNQIDLAFKDDDRHFAILMQRQGTAGGSGAFAAASVTEYGLHDIVSGESAEASGYLEAVTTEGDVAYFRFQLRAFFVAGPEGKTRVINNGHWELSGGTGRFAGKRGVGTMLIEFVNKTERRYLLEGDISPVP